MRIHISTTANNEVIPFDYQQLLTRILHKWIGHNNEEHGQISLYSFSWLQKGKKVIGGFDFPNGATWFISFFNENRAKLIIKAILDNPYMFSGMIVTDITIEETPNLVNRNLFYLASPIFIQRYDYENKRNKQYLFYDKEVSTLLCETLAHKMDVAHLPADDSLDIRFNLDYKNKHTKIMTYDGIQNRASMCPVFISGAPMTKAFAWDVGVGNSTGIGFGSIY